MPGGALIYFECGDLDDRVVALKAAGMVFDSGPEDQRWLWREARLSDPDGNGCACISPARTALIRRGA